MLWRQLLWLPALSIPASVAAQADDEIARGRALSDWSDLRSVEALEAASSAELKALIRNNGGAATFSAALNARFGAQQQVLDEFIVTLNSVTTYHRLARHALAPAVATTISWRQDGVVLAALARLAPPPIPADGGGTPATRLALPFDTPRAGSWFTWWGGRNLVRNHHMFAPDQRFANDFAIVRNRRTFDGDATRNDSYFCWNQPIRSPAAGRVAAVVDGIKDNSPVGATNARQPAGNHVIIEHAPGEFSLLAHFRKGTIRVKAGQRIAESAIIGRCGNSGNSSEPHLHFHLQTTGSFGGDARGLPARFTNYLADGRAVADGEPQRGEMVAPIR